MFDKNPFTDEEDEEEQEEQPENEQPKREPLPIEEAENESTDSASQNNDQKASMGWYSPDNSLAHATTGYRDKIEDRYDIEIPMVRRPDDDYGGNLYRAEAIGRASAANIEQELLWLNNRADCSIIPVSLGGTGYLILKLSGVLGHLATPIEVVVPSHRIMMNASDPEAVAQDVILQTAALPLIETGAILYDNQYSEVGYSKVAPGLAQLLGAMGLTDLMDRQYGYWTVYYETILVDPADQSLEAKAELNSQVNSTRSDAEPEFTPSLWAPWIDEAEPPIAGAPDEKLIVPEGYNIHGHQGGLEVYERDVQNAHLIGFVPLERDWIEQRLMYEGLQWLDRQIADRQNRYYTVLRDLGDDYGIRNPVAEWENFRDEHLAPALEFVTEEEEDSITNKPNQD